jgi:hypothetical protein
MTVSAMVENPNACWYSTYNGVTSVLAMNIVAIIAAADHIALKLS